MLSQFLKHIFADAIMFYILHRVVKADDNHKSYSLFIFMIVVNRRHKDDYEVRLFIFFKIVLETDQTTNSRKALKTE